MRGYRREGDRALMVEVAPFQFVNKWSAVALGLIAPGQRIAVISDDDGEDKTEVA